MAETQPGSEAVDPARVISGLPELDYTYVTKSAAASPAEAVELARFVLDAPASELEGVEVMLTPGIGQPEDGQAEFWAEDPGEWEEHGFRPTGDPVPYWKVVERDG
jgi:hypothetical protein